MNSQPFAGRFRMLLLLPPAIWGAALRAADDPQELLRRVEVERGICVVLGECPPELPVELARRSELLFYVQSPEEENVAAVRKAADEAGLLGTRIVAERGSFDHLHLATNLADGLIVPAGNPRDGKALADAFRVLRPGAKAVAGERVVTVPGDERMGEWSHPYHGPDNNPQSGDELVRGELLTQFLAEPWYVPMPQVTVASGGRIFKALGHIALKRREWPWLNTLVAINGYNGTQLWKRDLKPGFMIHRSTLIATPETLYLADDESCKLLDAGSGELKREITIPANVDAGGVWKWMALDGGVLFALIGEKEAPDEVIRGEREQPGWPWAELGEGYARDYRWGFGRVIVAIEPRSGEVLWQRSYDRPIDSRAMCLAEGRLFVYSAGGFLAALDAKTGEELWKSADRELLAAIGEHERAQNPRQGFASSAYAKANGQGVFFAGPQRSRLVAVGAKDGRLLWQYPHGNFQLILRGDGLYAMGRLETSKRFDYLTGEVLQDLMCYRGNCTRATACADSIFTRGYRHTGTMRLQVSGNVPRRLSLMRPACQDGVIVAHGQTYWGPWMCDCNHSLVGLISLAPAGDLDVSGTAADPVLEKVVREHKAPAADVRDWASYRGDAARSARAHVAAPADAGPLWEIPASSQAEPTAPIAAGGLVIWSGRDGAVRAADAATGEMKWTAYTGGGLRFPPEYSAGRVYAGSGDGWVYCLDAETGSQFWRLRAAPAERKIAVHGELLSTWPVGSGVLVHEGTVYAAAGISSHDGTHVYALDAGSGNVRWRNNSSGRLAGEDRATGVSVQGHLLLHGGRLFLAGGNVVSPAEYDAATGECLSKVENEWLADGAGQEFPADAASEMFRRSPRGRELFVVDGQVRVFDELLYSPPEYGESRYHGGHFLQAGSGDVLVRATAGRVVRLAPEKTEVGKPIGLWQSGAFAEPLALAVTDNAVIVAGVGADGEHRIAALSIDGGEPLWSHPLPAAPVSWGLAIDREGRAIVALSDGRLLAFGR